MATKKLGADGAAKLRQRLRDLSRADNLAQMKALPGHCEELKGDRAGQFSLRLHGGMRLIFEPKHTPIPQKEDGGTNWQMITQVVITAVEDYHK